MDELSLTALRQRMGDEYFGKRLRAQVDRVTQLTGRGVGSFHYENVPWLMKVVGLALRLSGLAERGRRNALQFTVRENVVQFPNLPDLFDGLRILQLSDLHLDGFPGLGARIAHAIANVSFDLCVLTGDFRYFDTGRYQHIAEELTALMPALKCRLGIYGILGNHDFIEMAPLIETAGVQLLLNEAVVFDEKGEQLWLIGLDDAHLYGLHDFDKALQRVPPGSARILLVHSPELIPQAAERGMGLYLTGHTHAGQLCLPGGHPVLLNARCERRFTAGRWQHNGMIGYTSAGVGSSGVFARFFCPPEIAVHILRCTRPILSTGERLIA
jgi:uncharacterized protein